MTSISGNLQPLFDIFNIINTVYLFAALGLGVVAAWDKKIFLFAAIFAGLFVTVFSKFSSFVPAISSHINSLLIFLIIGYSVSTGIKLAFNYWRGY